jgi:hypothetical protein
LRTLLGKNIEIGNFMELKIYETVEGERSSGSAGMAA